MTTSTQGSWGGLQIRTSLPAVSSLVGGLSSVLDIVSTALDIGLAALEIVKTFTIPTLNPIKAILDELITLCRNTLTDLRQLGLYAHFGDFNLVASGASLSQLKGGYAQYQRRMITRLTNRRDPTRPDFSPDATVIALFIYTSVDVSFVNGLVDTSKFQSLRRTGTAFASLLGMAGIIRSSNSLPIPANLKVNYPFNPSQAPSGPAQSSAVQIALATSAASGRNSVVLSWNISPSPGAPNSDPSPPIPPAGFLVEISCFPKGFFMGWMAPAQAGTGGEGGTGSTTGIQSYQTGFYQEENTGHPLQIMGGVDTIKMQAGIVWDNCFPGGNLDSTNGAKPAYFYRDPSIPETLHMPFSMMSSGQYINQRTLFVSRDTINSQALVGGTFTLPLAKSDLPLYARPLPDGTVDIANAVVPNDVYVRVISVTDQVTANNYKQLQWYPAPRSSPTDERVVFYQDGVNNFPYHTRGVPSSIVKVTYSTPESDLLTQAIQVALAVAILSRSDIIPADPVASGQPPATTSSAPTGSDTYTPTGLESVVREFLPDVIDNPNRYFSRRYVNPDEFTADLYSKIVQLTNEILQRQSNLPVGVIRANAQAFQQLINWKWSDTTVSDATTVRGNRNFSQTILESLTISHTQQFKTVLALNSFGIRGYWGTQGRTSPPSTFFALVQQEYTNSHLGYGQADSTRIPLIVDYSTTIPWSVRHVIPQNIYTLAATVLGLTGSRNPGRGEWSTVRPFVGVSALSANNQILQKVESFLRTTSAGISGIEDAILQTISFLEQRIKEIQETIKKIKTFLDLPFQITIPDLVALPLVANGTDGVITGLTGSANKPSDGPGAYSAGMVMMAGGLPSLLTDILLLVLGG